MIRPSRSLGRKRCPWYRHSLFTASKAPILKVRPQPLHGSVAEEMTRMESSSPRRFFASSTEDKDRMTEGGYGFRNWYDALFGNIKVDVFAPTSLFFIKFDTEDEIKAVQDWAVLTDKISGSGGSSTASLQLEACKAFNEAAAGGSEGEIKEEDLNDDEKKEPTIFEVEPREHDPGHFQYFNRFSGRVCPIPVDSTWNIGGDPNRFGFCAVASPVVTEPFPAHHFNVVELRVRTNLRSFLVNFRPNEEAVSRFQSIVRVPQPNTWTTIPIPFDAFHYTTRGRVRDIEWGLAEEMIKGVTITARSGDAIPWGEDTQSIKAQEFVFDLQWIRFVRRSQTEAEGLSSELRTMAGKEEYAEYLVRWRQKVDFLMTSGVVEASEEVAGFSLNQLLEVQSKDDIQDLQLQIEHEGIEVPESAGWTSLTNEDLKSVEEKMGIRNFSSVPSLTFAKEGEADKSS